MIANNINNQKEKETEDQKIINDNLNIVQGGALNEPLDAMLKLQQVKESKISPLTKERVETAKNFIERKYTKLKQQEAERKKQWDLLQKKMDELQIPEDQQDQIKHDILMQEAEHLRKKRQKVTTQIFDPIAIIGRGAFGEVRVCRNKQSKEIVAIKKMKKSEMVYKNQVGHVKNERGALVDANSPWIVQLTHSFQDEKHLYLVMEYVPGGDLMTLLMKKDILSENEAKFFIAETILAVESVHKMNYIHRDLKPDNILIDKNGHIKLSDFGLCKHTEIKPQIAFGKAVDEPDKLFEEEAVLTNLHQIRKRNYKRNRYLAYSTVGTPDYIAPEVFGQKGYTETVDWWSIGVILYEMLVGYPPFFSEDPSVTCQKILHWRKTLIIPPEANLSPPAVDLIKRLVTDANERLGINGAKEIQYHPFFTGIDWKNIRDKKSPYIPELKSEVDVSHFDKYEEEEPWISSDNGKKVKKSRKDANFIGFTYKRDIENERNGIVDALLSLDKKYIVDKFDTVQTEPSSSSHNLNNHINNQNPSNNFINNNSNNNIASITTFSNNQNIGISQNIITNTNNNINNNFSQDTVSKLGSQIPIPSSSMVMSQAKSEKVIVDKISSTKLNQQKDVINNNQYIVQQQTLSKNNIAQAMQYFMEEERELRKSNTQQQQQPSTASTNLNNNNNNNNNMVNSQPQQTNLASSIQQSQQSIPSNPQRNIYSNNTNNSDARSPISNSVTNNNNNMNTNTNTNTNANMNATNNSQPQAYNQNVGQIYNNNSATGFNTNNKYKAQPQTTSNYQNNANYPSNSSNTNNVNNSNNTKLQTQQQQYSSQLQHQNLQQSNSVQQQQQYGSHNSLQSAQNQAQRLQNQPQYQSKFDQIGRDTTHQQQQNSHPAPSSQLGHSALLTQQQQFTNNTNNNNNQDSQQLSQSQAQQLNKNSAMGSGNNIDKTGKKFANFGTFFSEQQQQQLQAQQQQQKLQQQQQQQGQNYQFSQQQQSAQQQQQYGSREGQLKNQASGNSSNTNNLLRNQNLNPVGSGGLHQSQTSQQQQSAGSQLNIGLKQTNSSKLQQQSSTNQQAQYTSNPYLMQRKQ